WIRLLNGTQDAGYVYLESPDPPQDPHLGGHDSYIVSSMPFTSVDTLLNILRNEKNLQIRFYDSESPDVSPAVFIESANANLTSGEKFPTLELADEVAARLGKGTVTK